MGSDEGNRCTVFTFVLEVLGMIMPGVAVWKIIEFNSSLVFSVTQWNDVYYFAALCFMVASAPVEGFMITATSCTICGYCGERCSYSCMCLIVSLLLIGLSLGALISMSIFFVTSVDSGTETQMKYDLQTNYINETSSDPVSSTWNSIQIEWECCGSTRYTDYYDSVYTRNYNLTVPWSCCVMKNGGSTISYVYNITACRQEAQLPSVTDSKYLHTKGCYPYVDSFLDKNSALLLAIPCFMILFQVLGIVIDRCCSQNTVNPVNGEKE